MMQIEQIRLKNFKAFADCSFDDIPKFAVFVGPNGSGKSTFFSVFRFLRNAMQNGAEQALYELGGARGFDEVKTRGQAGPIEIEIKFRTDEVRKKGTGHKPVITYQVAIDKDENQNVVVRREILKYRRTMTGQPWHFIDFSSGEGEAITNELSGFTTEAEVQRQRQTLRSPDLLAIKALSQFEAFPASKALGELIENWYVSDFHIEEARSDSRVSFARHLSPSGDNISQMIEYIYRQHRGSFNLIMQRLAERIPGIDRVEPKINDEGNVLIRFFHRDFSEPVLSRFVSDGTMRMLAYLVMLHDPDPFPLLCVEEPENQLYPQLLAELAEEFRLYARKGRQVFVSTHSPDFLNEIELNEVYLLEKIKGVTTSRRATDSKVLCDLIHAGAKLGELWREGFLFESKLK